MRAAVLVFPGSNCDRDLAVGFENAGFQVDMVWHKDTVLPSGVDIVGVPGGFSFGDYLRCGAIAEQSPIVNALKSHVEAGGYAIGICNGFQVLTETGLLPGVLLRNSRLKYICRAIQLEVATSDSAFTNCYSKGDQVTYPIAHHDGNYFAEPTQISRLQAEDRVAFRYSNNPNGSMADIAGVLSENRRVLGLMPHPERAADPKLGMSDGIPMFRSLAENLVSA